MSNESRNAGRLLWAMIFILVLVLVGIGAFANQARAEGPEFKAGETRVCSWVAVTQRADAKPVANAITYNVYHGDSPATLKLLAGGVSKTSVPIPVAPGQNYCGVVTVEAGDSIGPSPMSSLAPFWGTVPTAAPKAATGVQVK